MTGRTTRSGPWVDLVRDGVPDLGNTHGAEYDRLVWHALNRTALCALQAGYDFARWSYYLDESASKLGLQARRAGGRRERSARSYHQLLIRTWEKAEQFVAANPIPTADDVAELLATLRVQVADADTDLTDNQRAVLSAACDFAEEHGTTRPALPLPALEARTGLTRKAVRHALAGLAAAGRLTREVRGDVQHRRAALYRLHRPAARRGIYTPEDRAMCPTTQGYVPLPLPVPPEEEPDVATVNMTITGTPESVAALVSALRGDSAAAVRPEPERSALPQLTIVTGDRGDVAPRRQRRPA